MARYFYRLQEAGIKFEDMMNFDSADGGDGNAEGLCVSMFVNQFGGAEYVYGDNAEVVVMTGHIVTEIYDGFRIRPTREIARMSYGEWKARIKDETLFDNDWAN